MRERIFLVILFLALSAPLVFAEYEDLNLIKSSEPVSVSKNEEVIPLQKFQSSQGVNPGTSVKPLSEIEHQPVSKEEIAPLPVKNDPDIQITPLTEQPQVNNEPQAPSDKGGFYFEPGYGRLHFAGTQLQRQNYGKFILRWEPKLGYRIPIGGEVTLDPYLGGEVVLLGDQEEYFNHLAPALGLRSKIFKGNKDLQSSWGWSVFEDLELYIYTASYTVLNENGPDPAVVAGAPFKKTGPSSDLVYGFRFFKELKQEHFWQEWYFRFDHRSTDFRSDTYDDWLLFSNGKFGYGLGVYQQGAMEISPYYGFETFRNFKNKSLYFQNLWINILGFHIKWPVENKNVYSSWVRLFIELRGPIYLETAPATIPQSDFQMGIEFWNQ